MKLSQTPAVKSLDRGLDILEYVAGCSEPPSFSQLLGSLGIPRSSLFHLLTNLLSRKFLERDPKTERYRLGAEVIEIARKVQRPSLRDRVTPLLHQLSLEVSETCGFYVQVDDSVEVLASAISTQALSYTMKVGMNAPLYAVSAGKIVLSELRSEDLRQYLTRVTFVPVTPHTVRSKSRLKKEIQKVKATGFAYSRELRDCRGSRCGLNQSRCLPPRKIFLVFRSAPAAAVVTATVPSAVDDRRQRRVR